MRRSGRRTNESAPEPRFLRRRRASNRPSSIRTLARSAKKRPTASKLPIRRRPSRIRLCRADGRPPVRHRRRHSSVQTIVPHPARTGGNRRAANTGQPLGRHAANRNDLQITVVRRNAGENPSEYFRNMDRRPTKRAARYVFSMILPHTDSADAGRLRLRTRIARRAGSAQTARPLKRRDDFQRKLVVQQFVDGEIGRPLFQKVFFVIQPHLGTHQFCRESKVDPGRNPVRIEKLAPSGIAIR